MKPLSVQQLSQWLADAVRQRPVLLDVREPWEHEICRIDGSVLMPMREIHGHVQSLDTDKPVVCVCHHGSRSAQVAMFLHARGFGDVYNLTGGVDAWARQIDSAMATY